MAVYVLLLKESENLNNAVYLFGPNEDKLGRLQLKNYRSILNNWPNQVDRTYSKFDRT